MGRRGGDTQSPGQQIPADSSYKAGKDDGKRDIFPYNRLRHSICNSKFTNDILGYKEGKKVKRCRPEHCLKRRKHAGSNNGGNGVGCIVKTVDKIKYNSQNYYNNE